MKRVISIIMAVSIAFSCMGGITVDVSAAKNDTTASQSATTKRTGKKLTYSQAYNRIKHLFIEESKSTTPKQTKPVQNKPQPTQLSEPTIKMTDFWGNELSDSMYVRRNTLTADQRYLYDIALAAISNGETYITLNKSYSKNDLDIALTSMDYENPYLIWMKDFYYCDPRDGGYASLRLTYFTDLVKDRAGSLQAMDDYLKPMLTKASNLSSDIEKVKYVHDWLIYNTNDGSANKDERYYHGAHCAIVGQEGVCQAYSYAFVYCMQKLGIQSVSLHGTSWGGGLHCWNMVKVDDEWYELDVYWDDLYTKAEQDYDYVYFMQTTASLKSLDTYNGVSRTRSDSSGSTLLPTANGTKYSPSNYSYSDGTDFSNLEKIVVTKKKLSASNTASGKKATKKKTIKVPSGWYKYNPVLERSGWESLTKNDWTKNGSFYVLPIKNKLGRPTGGYIVYDAAYDNYYTWQSGGKIINWYDYKNSKWVILTKK